MGRIDVSFTCEKTYRLQIYTRSYRVRNEKQALLLLLNMRKGVVPKVIAVDIVDVVQHIFRVIIAIERAQRHERHPRDHV